MNRETKTLICYTLAWDSNHACYRAFDNRYAHGSMERASAEKFPAGPSGLYRVTITARPVRQKKARKP
jgi:hypothetical protein